MWWCVYTIPTIDAYKNILCDQEVLRFSTNIGSQRGARGQTTLAHLGSSSSSLILMDRYLIFSVVLCLLYTYKYCFFKYFHWLRVLEIRQKRADWSDFVGQEKQTHNVGKKLIYEINSQQKKLLETYSKVLCKKYGFLNYKLCMFS